MESVELNQVVMILPDNEGGKKDVPVRPLNIKVWEPPDDHRFPCVRATGFAADTDRNIVEEWMD